jgi:zinc protease
VLSAQRGTLPLVTVRAVLGAGAAAERAGEEGLAWLTAESLEGGTSQRPARHWRGSWSGSARSWTSTCRGTRVNVSFTTRSDRLGQALELLAEIVRTPAFPDREIERLRGEQLAEMLQRSTEPRALGDDSAVRFIFGEGETRQDGARPAVRRP